eukprot:1160584-Pelagomonas_calceolata.AAC.4
MATILYTYLHKRKSVNPQHRVALALAGRLTQPGSSTPMHWMQALILLQLQALAQTQRQQPKQLWQRGWWGSAGGWMAVAAASGGWPGAERGRC